MDRAHPARLIAVALMAAVVVAGCSFIDSSESISKSIGSSFASSSSSSPGGGESAYRDDVRDYTYAQVRAGQDGGSIVRGVGAIAQKHGISNWEASPATWVGAGEGLAKAKVNATELEQYKDAMAGPDAARKAQIQQGYDAYRRSA